MKIRFPVEEVLEEGQDRNCFHRHSRMGRWIPGPNQNAPPIETTSPEDARRQLQTCVDCFAVFREVPPRARRTKDRPQ